MICSRATGRTVPSFDENEPGKVRAPELLSNAESSLLGEKRGVERIGFAAWISQNNLLRARYQRGSHKRQGIHVLESYRGGAAADLYRCSCLEAAAVNCHGCAARGRAARRSQDR